MMFLTMVHICSTVYLMDLSSGNNMFHGYKLRSYFSESKSVLNRELFCVLLRYKEDGKIKYLYGAEELRSPEKSTLEVCFEDVEKYNQNLAATIIEEYYRYCLYLCRFSTVDTVTGLHAAVQILTK